MTAGAAPRGPCDAARTYGAAWVVRRLAGSGVRGRTGADGRNVARLTSRRWRRGRTGADGRCPYGEPRGQAARAGRVVRASQAAVTVTMTAVAVPSVP